MIRIMNSSVSHSLYGTVYLHLCLFLITLSTNSTGLINFESPIEQDALFGFQMSISLDIQAEKL